MSLSEVLSIITLVLVAVGGAWGIIRTLLIRDRNNVEKNESALWKRVEAFRSELTALQVAQGVLKSRLEELPDHSDLHDRLQEMQDRMDKRLEKLTDEMRQIMSTAASKFRCPASEPGMRLTDSGAKLLAPLLDQARREGRAKD